KLAGNRWDGDRDSWPQELDDAVWSQLTTDHSQCTGRHCPNFQQCSFYRAREGMTKVDVIVTNHDMVLADLALGGGAVLPDPRSEEHTSELQSRENLVCRLLLEKK